METINGQVIHKYALDTYLKYKPNSNNNNIPNELKPFLANENNQDTYKRYVFDLSYPQIRAYLSTYMNKKHNNQNDEIFAKNLQNLLNKVSKDNMVVIKDDIFKMSNNMNKKNLDKLCESIIVKSTNETGFADIYGKLCEYISSLEITENNNSGNSEKYYFKKNLLNMCQNIYEELIRGKKTTNHMYYKTIDYSSLNFNGFCKFLGELYKYNLLSGVIVKSCFEDLYKQILNNKSMHYESIHMLLLPSLPILKTKESTFTNDIKERIKILIDSNNKEIIFNKNTYNFKFPDMKSKFKLMDTLDLFNK